MSFKKIIPTKAIDSICLSSIIKLIAITALILIMLIINIKKTKAQCHIDDWTALKALYESTNGNNWTERNGWGTVLGDSPPTNCNLGNLYGVQLDETGRVNCLDLDGNPNCSWHDFNATGNNLDGIIPAEIGSLVNLVRLNLTNNKISGGIPAEIGNLSKLYILSLSQNQITGSIPNEIYSLNNLAYLMLGYNQLSGTFPLQLVNLGKLIELQISYNLFNGVYPIDIKPLCLQLTKAGDIYANEPLISEGNNFNVSWSEFCLECIVYPGDLNNDGIVDNIDASLHGLYLYNVGIARASEHQNTNWTPHPSQEWGILNNQNKDLKYHDCNGDGVIDENDWQAIQDNMGQMWTTPIPVEPPDESDYQVMLQPTSQIFDGFLVMNVSLERRAGGNLTVQGGYFTVDYSDVDGEIINAALNLEPISWLGSLGINLFVETMPFPDEKKIEVGFTKIGNSSTGSGPIGQLVLQYDNNASKRAGDSNAGNQFQVNTIGIHQNRSNFMLIEDQLLQVNLNSICQPNWTISKATPFQNLYKSAGNITTNSFVLVGNGQEIEYRGNRITLNSGFKVKAGASFKARYGTCNLGSNGLLAIYYNNIDFTGNSISRVDATINFNWGSGSPDDAIEGNTFSSRWEGFVQSPTSGTYTFYATADDGVRLWINNQLIIDYWIDQAGPERSGTIQMTAGQKVPVKIEHYENGGGAKAQLRWEGPGTGKQIIPNNYLFLN